MQQKRLIPLLAQGLSAGQTLTIEVTPEADEKVCVISSLVNGGLGENPSQEQMLLSAALAMPLKMVGTPEEIEDALERRVSEHREAIDPAKRTLAAIQETTSEASDKAATKGKSGSSNDKDDKSESSEESTDDEADKSVMDAPVSAEL